MIDIPERPALFFFFKGNEGGADLGGEGMLGEALGGMEGREIGMYCMKIE